MVGKILKNVYVGIDVKKSKELLDSQKEVCSKLNLCPKIEFHITIAYLNEISIPNLTKLGNALMPLFSEEMKDIKIYGIGGAFQENANEIKVIDSINAERAKNHARVLWWSIYPTDSLINFRNSLIMIAFTLNVSCTLLSPIFTPHIIIGSGGKTSEAGKLSIWDEQAVRREVLLNELLCVSKGYFNKIHITDTSNNPDSIFIISKW